MIGQTIAGKYELRRLVGTGSMGAVYEGVHLELGKRLAIKVIHPECCGSPEIAGRFRREAQAASAIESEHVAQIFDFGRDEAFGLYMVIEYLDGEDLEARLARERWIDSGAAAAIGWQVARGLARAHAAGVIHRDLKPANVFLTRRDDASLLAKILDFGISKVHAGTSASATGVEETLTERGTTVGTPQYMSPEQCRGVAELDGRTDVWSLCAVIYEMIAGEAAFSGSGSFVAIMERIVSRDACPLSKRAPWVPERLARVVDAGLVRDRNARIGSASVLADRLLEACPDAGVRQAPPGIVRRTDPSELAPDSRFALAEAGDDRPPPSSTEERVEVFVRHGERPVPVAKR